MSPPYDHYSFDMSFITFLHPFYHMDYLKKLIVWADMYIIDTENAISYADIITMEFLNND